jgi:raffinose/stachyose/melibiose transport system substrate-binding protein
MLSMDSYAVPSVDLAIKQTAMPGLISGEFTVTQAVAEVQKAARDYLNSRR